MQACRLIRLEAPLFLALTASSPFLDGAPTGYHSTRWQLFPKTPAHVPLFESHAHYIEWTKSQLQAGTMQNVRHLWSSVRPNGEDRPYNLNRLELRICDLAIDPIALLAVMALLEARIAQMLDNPGLDPLVQSQLPQASRHKELIAITEANESAVAQSSLDAQLNHWLDGRSIRARDWILDLYKEVFPYAKQGGYSCFLLPLKKILVCGNQAQQWLSLNEQGYSVSEILQQSITAAQKQEQEQLDHLCQPSAATRV
jgi:predicted glutamate--cysteine ligase